VVKPAPARSVGRRSEPRVAAHEHQRAATGAHRAPAEDSGFRPEVPVVGGEQRVVSDRGVEDRRDALRTRRTCGGAPRRPSRRTCSAMRVRRRPCAPDVPQRQTARCPLCRSSALPPARGASGESRCIRTRSLVRARTTHSPPQTCSPVGERSLLSRTSRCIR